MATEEISVPTIGENIESGDVVKVLVAVGDRISKDQPILELETDKAVVEVPSPLAGKVTRILVKSGETIKIGQPVVVLETSGEGVSPKTAVGGSKPAAGPGRPHATSGSAAKRAAHKAIAPTTPAPADTPWATTVAASPAVRRLARELGVELSLVTGTGTAGRVSADDVKAHVRGSMTGPGREPPAVETGPLRLPDFTRFGPVERESLSKVRKITAQNMIRAWTTIPHVTQFEEADVTRLEAFRRQAGGRTAAAGGKLTMTAILLKVCATALRLFPRFNSSLDTESDELILKKYYHIGVAVDTDRGLIVPVVRNVDRKPLSQVAVELHDLAVRTREKRVTPDELEGGTFTISNLGGIGGTGFSPIVYPPQVAILGVARAGAQAVLVDGEWQSRLVLPLSVSYDHRVIDGADGARFLAWIAEALTDPYLLVTES